MSHVGDRITASNASWSFGGNVHQEFDEHVSKSVPLYALTHNIGAKIADFFLLDGSVAYDLGCSTGTFLSILGERNKHKNVELIGYDVEENMTKAATQRCSAYNRVKILHGDIVELPLEPCDFVSAYYTIQFIRPRFRQMVFDKIYASLNWGGGFLFFEKVRAPDARFQDMMAQIYQDYKLEQGYSAAEVISKSRSIKGVLEPFSSQANLDMARRAGFIDVMSIYKYLCFEGFLAIK
jgi:tRNA (cmo5U34)-methyltransferase